MDKETWLDRFLDKVKKTKTKQKEKKMLKVFYRILTAVKSKNRHTDFTKVVNNGPTNISAKLEACI